MDSKREDGKLQETKLYRVLSREISVVEGLYHISCGVERCRKGKINEWPDRKGYHLHVILNGKGRLDVNGVDTDLKGGYLFLTKPGEKTVYSADPENPWSYCWVAFGGELAGEYMQLAGFGDGVNVQHCNINTDDFLAIVRKMLDHSALNSANDIRLTGLMAEFIALAIDSYNKERKFSRIDRNYSPESYVDYAVSYIETNYATINVEDVAKAMGIHRSHLSSLFKKQMGISPQEYLLSRRMREGCQLLRETELPIQQIAEMVGYENPLTFSKVFHKRIGVSPKSYRNAAIEDK